MIFFERKGKFLGSPAELVTNPGKSSLHKIIAAKNVIVLNGETLKNCLIKSICKMLILHGLKVTRVICTSVYEVNVQQLVNRIWNVLVINWK